MNTELLNILVQGGGTAILVWLVMDMRKSAQADRDQIWALLQYLIHKDNPNAASVAATNTRIPKAPPGTADSI